MVTFQDYEKEVFNWLRDKHKETKDFFFSTRKRASEGAEKNYFIGTEKSQYFGTTFWYIKTGYPGSAADLINVFFYYTSENKLCYYFEFNQTKKPFDEQNELALRLVQNLEKPISDKIGLQRISSNKKNYHNYRTASRNSSYNNVSEMMEDVVLDLEIIMPIVNTEIENIKKDNPNFIAHLISLDEFSVMQKKLIKRFNIIEEELAIEKPPVYKPKTDTSPKPLNQILYGPPGTGKTYNTILKAAQIIEPEKEIHNYEDALEIFNSNLHERIEFITFHQNYCYEDFIQGLRPDVENKGQLSFEKKDGIFSKMSINALFEYFKIYSNNKRKLKTSDQHLDVNEVYLSFFNFLKSNPNQRFKSKTGSELFIKSYSENNCMGFSHSESPLTYTVSGNRLIKLYEKFPSIDKIKNVNNDIREAIGGCNASVYWAALNEFIKYYEKFKDQRKDTSEEDLINYDAISFEEKKKLLSTIEFSELSKIDSNQVPNYVIIIDEINRANISRVFGELITLIEPDKRSHGKIPLPVRLPSGDEFIVPSNLYIIGTMNTADKSIALLDIALRRRFEFEAMYPLYKIDGVTIYDVEILEKINAQIIAKKGYDFQIGHSYFMEENSNLVDRMNKKVIPLLLEYFMNDKKEVEGILYNADLKIMDDSWPIKISGKRD